MTARTTSKRQPLKRRTDRDGDLVMDFKPRKITKPTNTLQQPTSSRINTQRKTTPTPRNPLKEIRITGWKNSTASSTQDGGVSSLINFLERKASNFLQKRANGGRDVARHNSVKISKYREEGDSLIISVPSLQAVSIVRLNGYVFAGVNINIEAVSPQDRRRPNSPQSHPSISESLNETRQVLQNLLSSRYNIDLKLLDLGALGQDAELNALGMFNSTSTQSKFFPALMKICSEILGSSENKRNAVHSVSLAGNQLLNVSAVTSLAHTFPDLKNLDLSNNKFESFASLSAWRHKFRRLDYLILSGNPLEQNVPDFHIELLNWYPTLRIIDGVQVRSDEEAALGHRALSKNPPPIAVPHFYDESQIAENFIRSFFAGFDTDRSALVNAYYDSESNFSFSINTHALRDPNNPQELKAQEWDLYIKRSRNLKILNNPHAIQARKYRGTDAIREVLTTLPITRHPDFITESTRWCIECQQQPGVPDPTGQSAAGVGGFLITIHGEYDEINVSTGEAKKKRSFDRTFIIGPGGPMGVRVVSDIWTVRTYGGYAAWKPQEHSQMA